MGVDGAGLPGERIEGADWRPDTEPLRGPRGLDVVTDVLAGSMAHSDMVRVLNHPHEALDGFTPVEWLQDDGAPSVVIAWALLTPAVLVGRLRGELGAKLVAYIAGVERTSVIKAWVEGTDEPPPDILLRLGTALAATVLLRRRDSAALVQVWFQGKNPALDDVSPARVLREEVVPGSSLGVVIAARRHVGLAL